MDQRIETVLEELKKSLGLQQFVLHTHSFSQEVSAYGGFDILLSADMLPPETAITESDDMLPDGTVSIRYSLRYQQLLQAVTQGERSFADSVASDEDAFLKWTYQHTDLGKGNEIVLTNRTENGIEGVIVHNDIPVQTDGFLQLEWDETGRIILCMLPLLAAYDFEETPFSMTLEAIEPLVRQHLTVIRLPIEDEARFSDYFAIDEVFISQDGMVLPYFSEEQSAHFPKTVLQWEDSSNLQFEKTSIQPFRRELNAQEAFAILDQPVNFLSDDAVHDCIQSATAFLSSELPEESGEWEVYRIMQQPGNVEVICRKLGEIAGPLRRKILIMLNRDTYEVMNFMDSNEMTQLFDGFTQPRVDTVSHEEAFEKMISFITLDPKYVFHQATGIYKLCGLLDSDECVDAVTGELQQLNDL